MEQFLIQSFVFLKFSEVPGPPPPFQNPAYATGFCLFYSLHKLHVFRSTGGQAPKANALS